MRFLPLATGDTAMKLVSAAPVPWPMSVTRSGSPPKAGRFSRSQWRPATRSMSPKFPWAELLAPVFRKPKKQESIEIFDAWILMERGLIKIYTFKIETIWLVFFVSACSYKEIKSMQLISVVSKSNKIESYIPILLIA